MSISTSPLFAPFTWGSLTLPNRIVMAPMTRNFSPGGVPGSDVAGYYARRAAHGVGLIITEGTVIDDPASADSPAVPRFHGDPALAGWARVLKAVREVGGHIVPQLWHVGSVRKRDSQANPGVPPLAPSGLGGADLVVSRPMTDAEIASVIDAYARGAADAKRLGFDGVELHGAHGYLIDQFFWETTNRRTDRYGGDAVDRTRFACEVVAACRRASGPDFPILFRFSQWKLQDFTARLVSTPDALLAFLTPLVDAGVDIFHCSTRHFWLPEFEGSHLNLAGWTKKLTGKPTITVGSVGLDGDFVAAIIERKSTRATGVDHLIAMVEAGEVDLVAVGRALLVDPAWAEKIRGGRLADLLPFTPDALKTLS